MNQMLGLNKSEVITWIIKKSQKIKLLYELHKMSDFQEIYFPPNGKVEGREAFLKI